jgi:hypothetical protein
LLLSPTTSYGTQNAALKKLIFHPGTVFSLLREVRGGTDPDRIPGSGYRVLIRIPDIAKLNLC